MLYCIVYGICYMLYGIWYVICMFRRRLAAFVEAYIKYMHRNEANQKFCDFRRMLLNSVERREWLLIAGSLEYNGRIYVR